MNPKEIPSFVSQPGQIKCPKPNQKPNKPKKNITQKLKRFLDSFKAKTQV